MTCVIGLLDKKEDCIYMGCDSMASGEYENTIIANTKIINIPTKNNKILASIAGDAKIAQFLETFDGLMDEDLTFDRNCMIKKVLPNLLEGLLNYGCASKDSQDIITIDGNIIFAFKNKLYLIETNGLIMESEDGYFARGSGLQFALGSLETSIGESTIDRIKKALHAGEKFADGVRKPFYIMNTKNDEVIKIS